MLEKYKTDLQYAYTKNKLVPFVGAGLSAPFKVPTWKMLIEELTQKFVEPKYHPSIQMYLDNYDYWKAIDLLKDSGRLKEFQMQEEIVEIIKKEMVASVNDENHNYKDLSKMKFTNYITTNYDLLLNKYINEGKRDITHPHILMKTEMNTQKSFYEERDYAEIWHIHGNITDTGSIVISKEKYDELYQDERYKSLMQLFNGSKKLLFIGFSMDDVYITNMMEKCNELFNSKHYIIMDKSQASYKKESLANFGINIIEYDKANSGHACEIRKILNEIADIPTNPITSIITEKAIAKQSLKETMMKNSADFYQTLRSPNGRFHHLNIVDTILPDTKLIDTNVKINDNSDIPLCNSAESLWDKGSKHAAIIGEGGMGKTVSLIRLWESYIGDTNAHKPIPIFIALNEYNNASGEDKKKYIIKYISKYYLKIQHISEEADNLLWKLLDNPIKAGEEYIPSIVLLLDGFNEITADWTDLLLEINEIITRGKGVQILVTSRYDMRENLNWIDFNKIELAELTDKQIEAYLMQNNIKYHDSKLNTVLKNPMMLTIYTASCEIMNNSRYNPSCEFKKTINSQGEILYNFIEAQIVSKKNNLLNQQEAIYRRFLLKNLLPYVAYKMEEEGKFYIESDELENHIDTAYIKFHCKGFYNCFEEYAEYRALLGMDLQDFNSKLDRFTKIKKILTQELFILYITC